jgi:hypothetical protein
MKIPALRNVITNTYSMYRGLVNYDTLPPYLDWRLRGQIGRPRMIASNMLIIKTNHFQRFTSLIPVKFLRENLLQGLQPDDKGLSINSQTGATTCTADDSTSISWESVQNFTQLGGCAHSVHPFIWSSVSALMQFHNGSDKRNGIKFCLGKVRRRAWQ